MRALTILQPYAWLIVHGPQRVENRTWFTRYRGPLLIHAGKRLAPNDWWYDDVAAARERGLIEAPPIEADEVITQWARRVFPRGALIGTCELLGCLRYNPYGTLAADRWAHGPFCWILSDVRAFPDPIPYRGQRGLFHVPDSAVSSAMEAAEQPDNSRNPLDAPSSMLYS